MQNFRFNTAIAALMEMNNWLVRTKDLAIYDTCGLARSHP